MTMVLFVNIFLLALPFLLFILLKRSISNNGKCNLLPPGPPALPFISHLHMLMLDNPAPHVFFWKLSQKYGSLMSLRFGFKPTLIVSSAKMAEEVMKTHDLDFCSRPNLRGARRLSYEALDLGFSPYTDYWKEMRKICVVHLFSRVHKYRSIREDEVARLVDKIRRLSICSMPVNLSESLMCLTSSIICRVGFARGMTRKKKEVKEADRFTGFLTRLEKTFMELDTFYQELIDEHLDPNRPKPEQEDIVDVLLRIRTGRDFPFDLTMDHIKAILMDVFIAGTDTVAAKMELALANLLYKFDWEMPTGMSRDDIDLATVPGLAVHKKNDLVLLATKIGD
ncbi:RED ELONGATED 1, SUPERROOT 2, ALTERED TRYPTOPHAN REGULATION 4, RUNT 1, cytochrome P450, family 83 [Hibiscus trionum]|uniref:RED ELONGATED 1, SUPERROOT 2, ALTERED TRYPTOPHAN REGULATION 4, RUNT 1, cytochrome P450, family 83 n=1 Tax=Hibiscus trionum TaxID=183268 RepID=A0A9W7LWL5_HIBTR|nr:RED ELONGATED 1, SUPERROOT 2, ALTERED TRYPTOPHAN REGULATION 4, RUNT 1, cytochrome P450, family 83 [Hibiscus trionum]